MRKILVIMGLCLLIPSIGYSKDQWLLGEYDYGMWGLIDPKNRDDVGFLIEKKNNRYDVTVMFQRYCNNSDMGFQFGKLFGTGIIKNGNMEVKTKDGSMFTLKLFPGDDYLRVVSYKLNPNLKVTWEKTDQCKRQVESIQRKYFSIIENSKFSLDTRTPD